MPEADEYRPVSNTLTMGVGWGIRGICPPTPAKGPQFGTKSRRMVFLSALSRVYLEKFPKFPCAYGANADVNVYSQKVAQKFVRFFNVLPLHDDFLGFLCIQDHILSFVPQNVQILCFVPPKVHILHFVPPPDFCHATPMTDKTPK